MHLSSPRPRSWGKVPHICLVTASVLALGACGGGGGNGAGSHAKSTTSTGSVAVAGSQATSTLAGKLKSANLGCADYADVPQNPATFKTGIEDIGRCDLGHLGVFANATARDEWIGTQLNGFKMQGCAEGKFWAVCLFPKDKVTMATVQATLQGVRLG